MMVFVLAFTMNRILTYHLVNLKLFSRPHYIHRSATCSVVAATGPQSAACGCLWAGRRVASCLLQCCVGDGACDVILYRRS